ncbi:unnamed protein product, partial [Mesorhabditis belari]|uniref:Thioesterase domain-containing protein n=1 Tax=Mesorhabditis belari TaxID=2138241 RepID=A0AAF3J1L2_9BILA
MRLLILLNATCRHVSSFHSFNSLHLPKLCDGGILLTFLGQMEPSTSDTNFQKIEEKDEELLAYAQEEFQSFQGAENFNRIAAKVIAVKATTNRLTCELTVENEHVNTKGTLHGGQAASLVDIVTARAVGLSVRDKGMASIEISLSYLSPVKLGDQITIEATVLKCGRNVAFTDCEFRQKSDGKLCVKGKHTIAILPGQPPVINGKAQLY